ncbi:MAG: hypothetical protein ACR65T_07035 [Methylocystis sp.]|uniref:hypothetical protein n=1 Tax=Methylocystis sp. TaxID=1911079 RepID=UPI003DA5A9A9
MSPAAVMASTSRFAVGEIKVDPALNVAPMWRRRHTSRNSDRTPATSGAFGLTVRGLD